jgi:hypothetical protein
MPPDSPSTPGERPLSDSFRVLSSITKLQNQWDFIKWSRELNDAFDLINGNYWEILNGDKPRPTEPKYAVTSAENVKRFIVRRDKIEAKRVTQQELTTVMQDHTQDNTRLRQRYEATVELWEDQNWRALVLLRSTIGEEAQSRIPGIKDVREAYLKMLSVYGTSWQNAILKWSKWTLIRFEPDMSPRCFVMRFENALQELLLAIDPSTVPPIVQFMQFVDAMRYHEGAHKFLATVSLEKNAGSTMKKTYDHFFACGPYRE